MELSTGLILTSQSIAIQLSKRMIEETACILGLSDVRLGPEHKWQACDAYANKITITPALVRHTLQL